ncbi:MAG: hypothetical protein HOO06_09060, partial [Bdellovibrionaceae bacterium]|nr:hypothetical protein [Pseudobdellovibrionaceae bacterium]
MVRICTYLMIFMAMLVTGCNIDNSIQGDSAKGSAENILDKFSLDIDSISSSGFNLKVNSTSSDVSKNKVLKIYYCNQTDNPGCTPDSFLGTMVSVTSNFILNVIGLGSLDHSGDQLKVKVFVESDQFQSAVSANHLETVITLPTVEADIVPNIFTFVDQTNVSVSTLLLSNIVQIQGIDTSVDVSILGDGGAEYRVCSDAACSTEVQTWGTTAGTGLVNNNDYVQVRLTSAASASTLYQASLSVGGGNNIWDVTTPDDTIPNSFSFTDQSNVALSSLLNSNILQISGISTAVDISVSGDGSPEYRVCLDAVCASEVQTWGASAGTAVVLSNNYVQLRLTSSASNGATSNATLTIGGTNDIWAVTTTTPNDIVPDAFNFTDQTSVPLSNLRNSDIVQITGVDVAVDVSVSGGGSPQYRVCSDASCTTEVQTWGSTAGTGVVNNNNYVQIRLTSSASNSALLQATLNVGTGSDSWDVTTLGDIIPTAFAFANQTGVTLSTLTLSDIVQISGIDTASDISVTGGDYRLCSDASCTTEVQTWGSVAGTGIVNNNHYVQVRLTSSGSNSTLAQASLTVGGTTSSNWDVTTLGDITPAAFAFTNQTG